MISHFDRIAPVYRSLRRIDYEPLQHIFKLLDRSSPLQGIELGCGTGRYSEILLKQLRNLFLHCVDSSEPMLSELKRNLRSEGINRFKILQKRAEDVSFSKNTFDALFSFNAIHHFDLEQILPLFEESVKQGGWIFFYTRLRSQNRNTIWGKFFPKFAQKENRLYTEDQLQDYFDQRPQLRIYSIMEFQYPRKATAKELLESADKAHYSTFCFYTPSEYKLARVQFIRNLLQTYGNPGTIKWTDRYTLLIARRIA